MVLEAAENPAAVSVFAHATFPFRSTFSSACAVWLFLKRRICSGVPDATTLAAFFAAFGAHVDDPVGRFDHVQLMFDHNDSIAQIHQALEHVEQALDVFEVQAGGGLVEDVERAAGLALAQFARQLDALRFAAG